MGRYLAKRLVSLIFVLLGISLAVFVLLAVVPGDTAHAILGPYATPERVADLDKSLGLDRPLPVQFVLWLGGVLHGDLGHSYSLDRPVMDVISERVGPTLLLGLVALVIGSVLGLLVGAVSARHRGRAADTGLRLVSLVGISTPAFWLGMLLMFVLSVWAGWFPVSGMRGIGAESAGPLSLIHHLALPALTLGAVSAGVIARFTRTEMLEAMGQDYIKVARAKGLSQDDAVYFHAFRVALARVVPVIGLQAGFVIGGAVYVETVFQWPGLGRVLVDAIEKRDVVLAQGAVLVLASAYVLVNLASDVAQRALDPRVEA